MRVLHLLDESADWPGVHGAASLAAHSAGVHACVLIGGGALPQFAAGLGLKADRIPRASTASPLRRLMAHRPKPGMVHAWSVKSAALAASVFPDIPAVLTLWQRPRALGWLDRRRAETAFGHCRRVMMTSSSLAGEYSAALGRPVNASVVELPVEAGRIDAKVRERVRSDWGVTPDTTVLAMIADPAASVDGRMVGYQAGVLSIAGRRSAAVMPSRARDVERARRFRGHHRDREWEVVVEDRPIWQWLPGCDVCVWIEDGAARTGYRLMRERPACLGIGWAAAAGVPVVAEDHAMPRELLGPRGAAYVAPGNRLDLNRGLLRLIDDQTWRTECTTAAREAALRLSPQRFAEVVDDAYANVAR